ncbi:hypothetical protein RhiirA5_409904 [Rhizophagus irregularis]|uniref:F-box domain-containing protein n=1 Tax=Rhizophagus irregularis TaxID=588596 RepID=A0A2I1E337_9GLOM|nr:hypothetical protein RhiirA5_409904 [Rhizophagus irregularis]PKC66555.1 hypothetical protein RhiirA1_459567 [Rhizophagus irregularis]PKY16553.1 hypothetical protein RhiirB3_428992 [Rhizophagus irregularis]
MVFNEDILSQIFEEIDDKNSLYSCLFVNRTWCVTAVPILWRNPNPHYNFNLFVLYIFYSIKSMKVLFDILLLLHLLEESRDTFKNQGIDINYLITEKYKRPLFNYVNFWKYLNLTFIDNMIYNSGIKSPSNIYQNCPNLKYFKLSYNIELLISELENLLINCKFLNGLVIDNSYMDELFILLTKSSPITLFKFEFFTYWVNLKYIKLFLDNWKDRNPMLLKLNIRDKEIKQQLEDLVKEYKVRGVIKKYSIGHSKININEDFNWN